MNSLRSLDSNSKSNNEGQALVKDLVAVTLLNDHGTICQCYGAKADATVPPDDLDLIPTAWFGT